LPQAFVPGVELKAAKLLHCISGWIKPLVLPLKVRPVEEPAGYQPISFSMLLMFGEFVCFAVDRRQAHVAAHRGQIPVRQQAAS
jgi:hypothetical protein